MKKMAVKLVMGLAAAWLFLPGSSVSAQQNAEEEAMKKAMADAGKDVASSVFDGTASGQAGQRAGAPMGPPMGMGIPTGSGAMLAPGSLVPRLDLTQTISRAMQSLSQLDRDQLATGMVGRNVPQLMEGGMGDISINGTVGQVMEKVREQMFQDIHAGISQFGQTNYRPYMQPQIVQSMISHIRPWEFPNRFKSRMIPVLSPKMAEQIKEQKTGASNL
jgi:hypothetical protein